MSSISSTQNEPESLDLLRAQRAYYSRAKIIQGCWYAATITFALATFYLGSKSEPLRTYLPLVSGALVLIDVLLISTWMKSCSKLAAKCQEAFDIKVLELPQNLVLTGPAVEPELVHCMVRHPLSDRARRGLLDWYTGNFDGLPVEVARTICQRMNVSYDKAVRVRFMMLLILGVVGIACVLAVIGVAQGLTLDALVLTWLAPLVPAISIIIREAKSHHETLDTLKTLLSETTKLKDAAIESPSAADLTTRSRVIQDAIFRHRTSNPLIFDWFYWLERKRNEAIAKASIKQDIKRGLNANKATGK